MCLSRSLRYFFRMQQPAAKVTPGDIERIVRRDFPPADHTVVFAMLAEHGALEWQGERERVQAAILKLAAGDLVRLRQEVNEATCDYRDVLAPAEYPLYYRKISPGKSVSKVDKQAIIEADWKQYQEWFERR